MSIIQLAAIPLGFGGRFLLLLGLVTEGIFSLSLPGGSHHPLACNDQYDLCPPFILPFPPSTDGSGASCSP